MIETLAEGHVLADKTGLGVENLQKFLSAIFLSPYMICSKKMGTGNYYGKEMSLPLISSWNLLSPRVS